ncbi:MAG: YIP1 family protein, partial [Caldilineaceae bacterium]|nr:YIP1 family protein [Caldilineaceae bacterium]
QGIRFAAGYPTWSTTVAVVALAIVGTYINWLVYGTLAHWTARWFGGQATLGRFLGPLALAYSPLLLAMILMIPGATIGMPLLFLALLTSKYVAVKTTYGLTPGRSLAATFTAEAANLSADARAQLEPQLQNMRQALADQETITPEQLGAWLAATPLSAAQIGGILTQTASAQNRAERLSSTIGQQIPQVESLLARIPLSSAQVRDWLLRLSLAPERLAGVTLQLGLTPKQIERLRTELDAAPEEINLMLAEVRAGVEQYHPPLGVRFSRFIRMFGEWLATPFVLLARWAYFTLMLLVAAKMLGGSGTIRQHLTGVLVAAAPLVLLFLTYVPTVTPMLSQSFDLAFDYVGRLLALVGLGWAVLILLKSMSVAHDFTLARAAGAVALTWSLIYVVTPVLSFLAMGYILRG